MKARKKKAAQRAAKRTTEMKEKIAYWFGMNNLKLNPDELNVFTFNGFGQELLKKEYKTFGYLHADVN